MRRWVAVGALVLAVGCSSSNDSSGPTKATTTTARPAPSVASTTTTLPTGGQVAELDGATLTIDGQRRIGVKEHPCDFLAEFGDHAGGDSCLVLDFTIAVPRGGSEVVLGEGDYVAPSGTQVSNNRAHVARPGAILHESIVIGSAEAGGIYYLSFEGRDVAVKVRSDI